MANVPTVGRGVTGAGMTHLLSGTGVTCRLVPCRMSRGSLDTIRITTDLNRGVRRIFGALILRKSGSKCFIYIVPNRRRISLGVTTGISNGGGYSLVPVGRLLPLAKCVQKKYSPVNVGGRFPACVRRAYATFPCVCVDTNVHKLRVGVTTSSLVGRAGTRVYSLFARWVYRGRSRL